MRLLLLYLRRSLLLQLKILWGGGGGAGGPQGFDLGSSFFVYLMVSRVSVSPKGIAYCSIPLVLFLKMMSPL